MIFKNLTEEKIFLFIMVIFGMVILTLTPPMCVPDENTHFLNAYAVANGDYIPKIQDGKLGRFVPKEIVDFISSNSEYAGNFNKKYSFVEQYFSSYLPNETGELVFCEKGMSSAINPAGYLVSGLGIWVGRIVFKYIWGGYDTPYNLLLSARFFQMLFYMIVCYYAIKTAPFLKKSMMIVLLMPMSLFLGVSVSYDAILIPVCSLFFSHTFGLIVKDGLITKKDILITGICTFFLVGIKTAYAPFLLLLLFIPGSKFGTNRKYAQCIIFTILVGLITFFGFRIGLQAALGELPSMEDGRIIAQKEYLLSHIYRIPVIAVRTLQESALFYLQSFYGKLGQLDTNFALPVMSIFYCLFLFVIFEEICSTMERISWKIRVVDCLLVLVCLGGIFLTMYLGWTPLVLEVGGDVVSGVQGRYFIPLFLFLCVPALNGKMSCKNCWSRRFGYISTLFSNVLVIQSAILTCLILLVRYWI